MNDDLLGEGRSGDKKMIIDYSKAPHLPIEKLDEINDLLFQMTKCINVMITPFVGAEEIKLGPVQVQIAVQIGQERFTLDCPGHAVSITPKQLHEMMKIFPKK